MTLVAPQGKGKACGVGERGKLTLGSCGGGCIDGLPCQSASHSPCRRIREDNVWRRELFGLLDKGMAIPLGCKYR